MDNFWDERYGSPDYVYGKEPNAFVAAMSGRIRPGPVLCLAEGEGRNATYLAGLGHAVTAVDRSPVALAKAARLAADRGVGITTVAADLADFEILGGAWSGIVATFAHLPPPIRRDVHARAARGLAPGGVFVLEAYTPGQLGRGTGGPREIALCMTLAALREELAGLEFEFARECVRDVLEGTGHTGAGAVVQVAARRPA
jgi:SAM-dependent methyltransferase